MTPSHTYEFPSWMDADAQAVVLEHADRTGSFIDALDELFGKPISVTETTIKITHDWVGKREHEAAYRQRVNPLLDDLLAWEVIRPLTPAERDTITSLDSVLTDELRSIQHGIDLYIHERSDIRHVGEPHLSRVHPDVIRRAYIIKDILLKRKKDTN